MPSQKINSSLYGKLYQDGAEEKKIIESLKKRLNDKILTDQLLAKKAAALLERWLKNGPKK